MESEGYLVGIVEKWNPHARVRQDLWGFLDLMCAGKDVVGVQTTTADNMAARRNKIRAHVNYAAVEGAGIRIELHGWRKAGRRWEVKREVIS